MLYAAKLAGSYAAIATSHSGAGACAWWKKSVEAWAPLEKAGTVPRELVTELKQTKEAASACP